MAVLRGFGPSAAAMVEIMGWDGRPPAAATDTRRPATTSVRRSNATEPSLHDNSTQVKDQAEIDTFISEVSTTSTNIAAADSRPASADGPSPAQDRCHSSGRSPAHRRGRGRRQPGHPGTLPTTTGGDATTTIPTFGSSTGASACRELMLGLQ